MLQMESAHDALSYINQSTKKCILKGGRKMDLKETLYFRVSILEDNQVISRKVAAYTRQMIDMVLEQKPDVPQDRAEMFFTHLAMAGKRAEEGTEENPMDETIFAAVKMEPVFGEAVRMREGNAGT